MALTLAEKIIQKHIVPGSMDFTPGQPIERGVDIAIKIDQTLTQDATGTMAYLQFETIGVPRVKTEVSVSYVDHNTLQTDFKNHDDHRYLQSIAAKYGLYFSRPGNGAGLRAWRRDWRVPAPQRPPGSMTRRIRFR